MPPTKYTFLILWAVLFSATFLFAEQAIDTIHFKVYGLNPGDYSNILTTDHSGKTQLLEFKNKQRSVVYSLTLAAGNPWLFFYRQSPSANTPNQFVGKVEILARSSDLLLIFSKDTNDPESDQFMISAMDDARSAFPNGSLRVLNFTGAPLKHEANGKQFNLRHREVSQSIDRNSSNKADITVVVEGTSRYHLVYKNKIELDSNGRALLILRPPVRTGSVKIGGHLLLDTLD